MRLFGKKRERREANMNGSTASQDVTLDQLTHVDQSLPTKIPKQPTLWKRLRQKWRRRDKNMNGFIDIEQNVEVKMNESTDYQDVVLNDSFPATKPKKPTLWKRLKHQCKIHDKEEKDCGNNKHPVNFEPQVTNVSLEAENNEPEVTIVSLEAENNEPEVTNVSLEAENKPQVMNVSLEAENVEPQKRNGSFEEEPLTDAKAKAYLQSHRDFLFEYLHSHHSVLCGYVHKQVPIETLKSWLAAKKGSSLNQSEDDESEESDDSDESESESNQDELIVKPKVVGNWVVISTIGEGSCAIVSKAQNINSAEEVALKEAKNVAGIQQLRDEATMMKSLDHKNILKFIDIVENPMLDQVFLVLEYVDGDTLKDQVALRGTFTEREAWHFMEQMASAFAYMHSHNIVHRDIKLVNILCSRGVLKVIDFGLAVSFTPGENIIAFGGTPGYMAPEVSEFEFEGPPADVWALGIVFTKLFLGLQFNGQDIIKVSPDTYDFIVVYSPPPSASEALVSLLTGMLLTDPSERFTMQEIVNHTWFEENRPMEF